MKKLPKEFILTNFERQEGTEVLMYHGNNDWLMNEWEYLVIRENNSDVFDEWNSDDLPDFPKISYKDWKEIVSQTFPEKWYIVLTSENFYDVNKWRKSVATHFIDNLDKHCCSCSDNVFRVWSEDIDGDGSLYDYGDRKEFDDYVEITFEQFKKFVLKEDEPTLMKIDWNKIEQPLSTYFVKINGNDIREIYENSNRDGKLFLENKFEDSNIFNKEFELSNVDIDFLRGTCNKEVVTKIFGEVIDFDKLTVGSKIELKDGTIGQIVILKSEWFIGNVHNELFKNGEQCYTTIITEHNNFIHHHQDKFLTRIKQVIE